MTPPSAGGRTGRVRHPLARFASLALVVGLVATGCTIGPPPPEQDGAGGADPSVLASRVDVDTPRLRAAKAAAGIEPCEPGPGDPTTAEPPLPDLTLACLGGGESVSLRGLRGPLVINLFAQWCEPCRDELPYYQRLHEEGDGSVRVLGIDYLDTQPDGALALARATGVTFPLLADPSGELRGEFRIRGLPGVVLVDEEGGVVDVQFRVIDSYDELAGLVAEHLGVTV